MNTRNSHRVMRMDTHRVTLQGCSGGCDQGRRACDCELADCRDAASLDLVVSQPVLNMPLHLTGGRIPRVRRVRRWWREFARFVMASRWMR